MEFDQTQLMAIRPEVADLIETVGRAVVATEQDFANLGDVRKVIKARIAALEEGRKKLVKPLNDHVNMINGEYRKVREPLEKADKAAQLKQTEFARAEEKRRQEEAERQRKAAEQAALEEARRQELLKQKAEETAQKAAEAGDEKAEQAALGIAAQAEQDAEEILEKAAEAPMAETAVRKSRGVFGSSSSARKVWTVELVDLQVLPTYWIELIMNNEKAKAAIITAIKSQAIEYAKEHGNTINGLNVYQDTSVTVR